MFRTASKPILFALGALVLCGVPAMAQPVQLLGDFNAWSAYTATDGSGRICFSLTRPSAVEPQPEGYAEAFLYLTHRTGEGVRDEFNLVSGYRFAEGGEATLTVGGTSYRLYTEADAAWLDDPGLSDQLAGAMRAGSTIAVEGTTERGLRVRQEFSLMGATAASRAADEACG